MKKVIITLLVLAVSVLNVFAEDAWYYQEAYENTSFKQPLTKYEGIAVVYTASLDTVFILFYNAYAKEIVELNIPVSMEEKPEITFTEQFFDTYFNLPTEYEPHYQRYQESTGFTIYTYYLR